MGEAIPADAPTRNFQALHFYNWNTENTEDTEANAIVRSFQEEAEASAQRATAVISRRAASEVQCRRHLLINSFPLELLCGLRVLCGEKQQSLEASPTTFYYLFPSFWGALMLQSIISEKSNSKNRVLMFNFAAEMVNNEQDKNNFV